VEKDRISKVSGIPSSQWYDTYLELSTMVRKSRIAAFKGIIDKSVEEIIGLEIKILVVGREGSLIKSIGTRKNVGGMGFKDFRNFNKALLAKQSWKLWQTPDSFLAKIMEGKYYLGSNILEALLSARPYFAWSIQSSCFLLKSGLI
jgi:hypothetical protein